MWFCFLLFWSLACLCTLVHVSTAFGRFYQFNHTFMQWKYFFYNQSVLFYRYNMYIPYAVLLLAISISCACAHSCSVHYTHWNSTGNNGNLVFLDRQRLNCGGPSKVMTGFQMRARSSDWHIRYRFQCCSFNGTCRMSQMDNPFTQDGNGDAVYINRQRVTCGLRGLITEFRLDRNDAHDHVRYQYQCCNAHHNLDCETRTNSYTIDGDGRAYYLDRQNVQCAHGYALNSFWLERNSGHTGWRYKYNCCRI